MARSRSPHAQELNFVLQNDRGLYRPMEGDMVTVALLLQPAGASGYPTHMVVDAWCPRRQAWYRMGLRVDWVELGHSSTQLLPQQATQQPRPSAAPSSAVTTTTRQQTTWFHQAAWLRR